MTWGAGSSKWNHGIKKTRQARTVGSPFFPGSNWKQEDKNKKKEDKAAKKAAKRARRR